MNKNTYPILNLDSSVATSIKMNQEYWVPCFKGM